MCPLIRVGWHLQRDSDKLSGHRRVRLTGAPLAALRRLVIGAAALRHNETPVLEYPERDWNLVAFPAQKGPPYVADNLATVNAHAFLTDPRFVAAERAASNRWTLGERDIRWRLQTFLWAAETALRMHPEADLVEFGAGNGFMAAGACEFLDWGNSELTVGRKMWLFDSFETTRRDEIHAGGSRRFMYAAGDAEVRTHFAQFPGVHIVTGWLPEAIEKRPRGPIGFVHVDLNHAGSEIQSLARLDSDLVPGAVILFDDSGNPGLQAQLEAHLHWAQVRAAPFLQLPTGQGLCIIPPTD